MQTYFIFFQIILAILLCASILLQNRGTGLSMTFGGGGGGDGSGGGNFYSSKRGVEKLLARFTVILAFLFLANACLIMLLPSEVTTAI